MHSHEELAKRREGLQKKLDALLDRRAAAKTLDERVKMMPEAARIMSAIREVEEAMEKAGGRQ